MAPNRPEQEVDKHAAVRDVKRRKKIAPTDNRKSVQLIARLGKKAK